MSNPEKLRAYNVTYMVTRPITCRVEAASREEAGDKAWDGSGVIAVVQSLRTAAA